MDTCKIVEITGTCKTRACISRSHSQVRQIQSTNLSTPKHLSYKKEMVGGMRVRARRQCLQWIFTMTEPSCCRPGSALSLGAAPPGRRSQGQSEHTALVAALLSSSAPRHPDIQPSDKYPGQCLPRHSRMLTGKMPVRCTGTGLMTRGWGLVTNIDRPATFGSRRQQGAAGGSRRGQELLGSDD